MLDFRRNVLQGKVRYQAIRAYLAQICFNKWMERYRSVKRMAAHEDRIRYMYEGNPELSPEEGYIELEKARETGEQNRIRLAQIEEGMQTLTQRCRQILRLAIVDELPMARIAEVMKLANANVAKTTKSRCYHKLLEYIGHFGK